MICPSCKIEIDDDSLYCDQCGNEILVCSSCGKPGKGKVCTQDGKPLIRAREKGVVQVSAPIGIDLKSMQDASGKPAVVNSPSAVVAHSQPSKLILINKTLGLILEVESGDTIGRAEGRFATVFNQFKKVSRKHCIFQFDPQSGWTVTDMGSTNGTKYNGVSLEPHKPVALKSGSYLIVGNIEFYVELQEQGIEVTER